MLNPGIGKLIDSYENRYKLVIDVAKRARGISDRAESNNEILIVKPITLAINEMSMELDASAKSDEENAQECEACEGCSAEESVAEDEAQTDVATEE